MTHNEYMIPAMVLIERWKLTKSSYPLYIMITERITKENVDILLMLGYHIIYIEEFIPANYLKIFNSPDLEWQTDLHGRSLEQGGWVHSFNKVKVWTLTQFDKVCFLDIDLFILNNLDKVFDYPEFTCAWRDYSNVCSQIFIAEPNLYTYKAICNFADNYIIPFEWYKLDNVLYTDEDIFRDFFKLKNYLPHNYNYQCFNYNEYVECDRHLLTNAYLNNPICDIKTLHFTSKAKPWIDGKEYLYNLDLNTQYLYISAWNLYVDTYETVIRRLKDKGVIYEKI